MDTIHFIGQDPFSTLYTSPDQLKLYKVYKRKNPFTQITCDGSSSVAHKLGKMMHKHLNRSAPQPYVL